ncbi:hypothetical protein ACP49_09195 [Clostridium botulinum]|uniref:hypothetical protein n=1 Tax=Clostridium botulinum TaxID=1491 RepID=UPI0006A75397|nr:hypothetical protein [Clostridium botulinum]KOM97237.1 hypothetical protein ACP53_04085 [Clostridium botulinum]KON00740.1 hypothetical protein ACP49_09195 [Clostridium botulinum]MBY7003514.1 hypothetical protein [Clostridium botulinum]MCR1146012.1 hypothetical protein [Clostridium botulinum]NFH93122.1 hypothetical protein [Clostridium botulinum]
MEQTIIELIGEISKIATKIIMETKHEVFISIRGHVQSIEIEFYKNGWESHKDATFSDVISFDSYYNLQVTIKRLRGVLDTLRKLYKNGQVNKSDFDYEEEVIKHYKFK